MTSYDAEHSALIEAAQTASKLCMTIREQMLGTPQAMEKVGREPVTIADYGAQAIVLKTLKEHFPDDAVIAEEKGSEFLDLADNNRQRQVVRFVSRTLGQPANPEQIAEWMDFGSDKEGNRMWTVDPIDGTKGFIRGDQFAIAIALLIDGVVTVGALACPALPFNPALVDDSPGSLAIAVRGQGATIQPLLGKKTIDRGDPSYGLSVTSMPDPAYARVVESVESGHTDHSFSADVMASAGIGGQTVRMDSQAKYLAVADGRADIYIRNSRGGHVERIWDHAAGALIVEEAGGRVTDLDGNALDFSLGARLEANRGVLATNRLIHDLMLEKIAEHSA